MLRTLSTDHYFCDEIWFRQVEHDSRGTSRNIPPSVILTAELEIAEHNSDLCACDDQDHKHEAEEAEEVVELVQPHGGENEEELNEDGSKRQNASNEDAEHRVHVPRLLGDLPGDFVGAHRVFKRWRLVAKVGADKHKRH